MTGLVQHHGAANFRLTVKASHPAEPSNVVHGPRGHSQSEFLCSCQSLHFFGHRQFSYGEEGSLITNITTPFLHVHNYRCKHEMPLKRPEISLASTVKCFLVVEVSVTDPRARRVTVHRDTHTDKESDQNPSVQDHQG